MGIETCIPLEKREEIIDTAKRLKEDGTRRDEARMLSILYHLDTRIGGPAETLASDEIRSIYRLCWPTDWFDEAAAAKGLIAKGFIEMKEGRDPAPPEG